MEFYHEVKGDFFSMDINTSYKIQEPLNRPSVKNSDGKSDKIKDSVSISCENNEGTCIIMPSRNFSCSSAFRADMETNEENLKNKDVKIEGKLSAVGAFMAKLDAFQKEELKKGGYNVYEDKIERWISEPSVEEELQSGTPSSEESPLSKIRTEHKGIFETSEPVFQKYTGKGVGIAVIDTGELVCSSDCMSRSVNRCRILRSLS